MTKREFFILLIKVFGLYSAVATLFSGLPSNVLFGINAEIEIVTYVWLVAVTFLVAGLFWILIFKADKLVDLLKLEKGFSDERIELGNIKSQDIIKIGVFIIGGLLIIKSVPLLLNQLFGSFKGEIIGQEFSARDKFNLGVSVLNLLLGYLLFTNYDTIARRLNKKKEGE